MNLEYNYRYFIGLVLGSVSLELNGFFYTIPRNKKKVSYLNLFCDNRQQFGFSIFNPFHSDGLSYTVKPVLSGHLKIEPKIVFKTDYRLIQVESIAECSTLYTFIKPTIVITIFVLSIF